MLVVDEAHKIKNYETQNFAAMAMLKSQFRILLTGTPLSNNLTELWTLLYFIMPGIFNDNNLFREIEESVEEYQGS